MKRIVPILLCAVLLLGLCPAARAEETVGIGSREEMLRLAEDPTGSFELTADIDMGGEPWTPLPFSGKLNGHGHTLYNLTVTAPGAETATTYDGNLKEYETVFGGLFSVVTNADIREVNLVNAVVDVTTDQHCFIAALAGYADHSHISKCTVQARNHLTLTSINAGVGGIAGFSVESEFSECTADAELVFTDTNQDVLCEEFIGGIYACGYGDVTDCLVYVKGFSEVYGYCHNGGIIGMYKRANTGTKYKTHVTRCNSYTEISFFEITPSRRAYCSPTIGEDSKKMVVRQQVYARRFVRYEAKKPERLSPEKCDEPQYTEEVTPGDCTTWGYTTHTCSGCGYSYRDSYTPPVHQYAVDRVTPAACTEAGMTYYKCTLCGHTASEPIAPTGHAYVETVQEPTCTEEGAKVFTCAHCGDSYSEPIAALGHRAGAWTLAKAPQVNVPGEEEQRCEVCGAVLDRREVAALPYVYAEELRLSAATLDLFVGEEARLTAVLAPADATEPTFTFTSDQEAVARVAADGTVRGYAPGTATVSCVSADGRASASCTVTVTYTTWQWVKHYVLFGWLWE